MTSITNKMTAEQFAEYARTHGRCELIHGEVRDLTPASYNHGAVTSRLHVLIGQFVMTNRLGEVFAAETGFRLDDEQGPVIRAPDIAIITAARLPKETPRSFATIAPDLIVETVSPGDSAIDVSEKILWWLSKGVREAWVADPTNKTITLHWPDGTAQLFALGQTLDQSTVLPGLAIDLKQIFTR